MYTILDFYFLGQTYIIVYVGAIAIQFQFVIMMIPIDLNVNNNTKTSSILSSFTFQFIVFLVPLFIQAISQIYDLHDNTFKSSSTLQSYLDPSLSIDVFTYFYPSWSTVYISFIDLHTQANSLYQVYPVSLLLIGIALYATMIGIIAVTAE